MDTTAYGLRIELPLPFEAAVARTTEALRAQGFGVLTTIDVQQTLKQKLGKDFGRAAPGRLRRCESRAVVTS